MSEMIDLLTELLDAYILESSCLNDPREPERYREMAQDLVDRVRAAIADAERT